MNQQHDPPVETPTLEREPRTAIERLTANARWQPAIPAVLVFFLMVLLPSTAQDPAAIAAGEGSAWLWLLPVGILASCGLAIAAGFCSVFPQLAWLAIALYALGLVDRGLMPGYNRIVLLAGMVAVVVMLFVQVWRVRTGRFVPTIRESAPD